ncbi:MAG: twin transmembrane helix small protein [Sphingomonas sp.]
MTLFAVLLLVAVMLAILGVLAAGLVNLARSNPAEYEGEGPSPRALRSNKLMQYRILLQAVAIGLVALILLFASAKS